MRRENLTKKYIYESFYAILLKQQYDSITVSDICKRAGISRMSFYRNFESKDDLIVKSIGELTKIIKKNVDELEIKNQFSIIKIFFEIFLKYKDAIHSFENSNENNYLLTILNKQIQKNFQYDFINKTSMYIPIFYFNAIGATIIEWLKHGANETPDDMSLLLCSLINENKFEFANNTNPLFPPANENN